MVILLSLLLLPLALSSVFDSDDVGSDLDETQLTKLMSCALIASEAIDNDASILQLISDSVHDPDSTLEKLAAELCSYCYYHISEEFAERVMDEGIPAISDPEASELIAFNKTKYMIKGLPLSLTDDESMLMSTLMELLYSESGDFSEDGSPQFLDSEEFSDYSDEHWSQDEPDEDWEQDWGDGEETISEQRLREILMRKGYGEDGEEDFEEVRGEEL